METITITSGRKRATVLVGDHGQAFRIYWRKNEVMFWRTPNLNSWFVMKWEVDRDAEEQMNEFVEIVKQKLAKRW